MSRRQFNNKDYQKKPMRRNFDDSLGYGYKGKPAGEGDVKAELSVKALRDLPHSSYAIKADPYTAALPTSEPYPIINKFNRVINANYSGDDNIDGGNVQQYANSVNSLFLKYFDVIRTKINVNYRYLPISDNDTTRGKALIDEMRKSIAEAVSVLKSTTFTQMAITRFAVKTTLPMGSATPENISKTSTPIMAYTNLTDVIYAMSIYYQLVLQDGLSALNWHNAFRLKQGTMIRNAWNREVPNLNSLFGLFNKKSFLSLIETIGLSFEGEYVDRQFMEQMNTLALTPSRRSDSITDPILELQIGWNHPSSFSIYILDDEGKAVSEKPFFSDVQLMREVMFEGKSQLISYWDACDKFRDYMSIEATTLWARSEYQTGFVSETDNARYNNVKALVDVINSCFVIFKPLWSDFREALDVMTRTGTVNWSKGLRPSVVKDTSADIFHNLIVEDIFNMIFSGASKITFDTATKRWRYFSKWNMYNGIPLYDIKSGGAFLAFSFKASFESTDNEQIDYIPVLFSYVADDASKPLAAAVSRDGVEVGISYGDVTISQNQVLSRLAPLTSQASLQMRVPGITGNEDVTTGHRSSLYKTLTQVFGAARVRSAASGTWDYALDPDIIAIYQIEISDITNMAITYARANAPFRGTTSTAEDRKSVV